MKNRRITRFLCLLLGGVIALSAAVSCKNNPTESSSDGFGDSSNSSSSGNDIGKIEKTDKTIVVSGVTSYKILLPENASTEIKSAANELRLFFGEATNATLSITSDYIDGEKYFSLGQTAFAEKEGIKGDYDELGLSGYRIKTVGENICIYGYTDTAVIYGVYEYLERMFNYDYYYVDTYSLDKTSTLYLYNFDCIDVPDFEKRVSGIGYINNETSQVTKQRMRMELYQNTFINNTGFGGSWHNCFWAVPPALWYEQYPEWYNDDFAWANKETGSINLNYSQLCYSAHGYSDKLDKMLEVAADNAFRLFQENPNSDELSLNMLDNEHECECDACLKSAEKYGSMVAPVILFFNRLAAMLEQKFEEANDPRKDVFQLSFYAYYEYAEAPVQKNVDSKGNVTYSYASEMKLNKHVTPLYANVNIELPKSPTSETNAKHYETLDKWMQIAPNIHVWLYDIHFWTTGYMVYYNSVDQYQAHFRKFRDAGANWIMLEASSQNNPTAFVALRTYLVSKLLWNVEEDIEELTNKFFKAMYGSQSETMKKIYIQNKVLSTRNTQELNMSTNMQARDLTSNSAWWPKNLLSSWYEEMTEAEAALTKYGETQAAEHVKMEQQAPLYMLITMWRLTYSENQLRTYAEQMRDIFNHFDVTQISQRLTVADSFAGWGLSDIYG